MLMTKKNKTEHKKKEIDSQLRPLLVWSSRVLPMSVWVFYGDSGFLSPPKDGQLGELSCLNCPCLSSACGWSVPCNGRPPRPGWMPPMPWVAGGECHPIAINKNLPNFHFKVPPHPGLDFKWRFLKLKAENGRTFKCRDVWTQNTDMPSNSLNSLSVLRTLKCIWNVEGWVILFILCLKYAFFY